MKDRNVNNSTDIFEFNLKLCSKKICETTLGRNNYYILYTLKNFS